ncbi:MAG: 4-hydroxybenzoyl-CoA reductase [Syntrophus sp. (in: bacteria)]|nr:4-hydroxybenzoyl-CoA reductase [Syntrophus sp. (in: bacteria)]
MALKYSHPKYSQFRFDAGSAALNFVATVRHRGSRPRDLLSTSEAIASWFRLAGCSMPVVQPSVQYLEEALLLREAIYRTVLALILGEVPNGDDRDRINLAASYSLATPNIDAESYGVQWKSPHPARACLSEIARDAVMIIGDTGRQRLKMCDNPSCRMLFVDQSPAKRRRWCAMSLCGNREKIRTHRQRKRGADNECI